MVSSKLIVTRALALVQWNGQAVAKRCRAGEGRRWACGSLPWVSYTQTKAMPDDMRTVSPVAQLSAMGRP